MKRDYLYLAGIAACVLLLYKCDAAANQEIGALNLRATQLESDKISLMAQAGSLATRFRVETVAMRDTVVRFRRFVDSIFRFDTIPITKRETLIVERAAAAISSCERPLATCNESMRNRDRIIAISESLLTVERARRPSLFDKTRNALVFIAAGYVLHMAAR